MIETPSRNRPIAIWVLREALGLAFLTIGVAKLTGSLNTVQKFEAFGWGQWFRYVAGLLDVIRALLLFVPRRTYYGALLLACLVGLATVLSFRRPPDFYPALALTLLAATLAWLTRPREASSGALPGTRPLP